MFNTFALTRRPDEIRLFIVFLGAVVSAALMIVARALRTTLAHASARGRRGILSPLGRVITGTIVIDLATVSSPGVAALECGWFVDGTGRLVCRWTVRRLLAPPH